jgi:hypothetical protein
MFEYALAVYLLMFVTWAWYLGAMNLKEHIEKITPVVKWPFAYPFMVIGYALDVSLNIFTSLLFLDVPHEVMFTGRMERYLFNPKYSGTRRQKMARWICANLLDPFTQFGQHCFA